ncbi:uncharacterized protein LOC143239978 [Tachypleus tridentatus]|uniref:uncharacterized protein LOC143239978 n=1 Tax=Tachypleus tridentatus TaxID=6853 RepID=UPI003FD419CA
MDRMTKLTKLITVEPVLFLHTVAVLLEMSILQDLIRHKVCLQEAGIHNTSVCKHLDKYVIRSVQDSTVIWVRYYNVVLNGCGLLACTYLGSWGDRFGRKIPLVFPPLGSVLSCVNFIIVTTYIYKGHVSLLLVSAVLSGFSGGTIAMTANSFGYLSDITTEGSRTLRTFILEAMLAIGVTIGLYVGGAMLRVTSYCSVFLLELSLCAVDILYILFCLKDIKPINENQLVNDSSQPVKDSNRSVKDSNQPVTDSGQPEKDSNRSVKDSNQPNKDSNQPVKDSGQPVKDSNRSVKDSGQPVKDSNRSVKDSGQPVKDSNRSVKDSGQLVNASNRSVKDSNQPNKDSNQPNKDSNQPIKDSNQPVKDSGQPVKDSNRSVKDSGQLVKDSNRSVKDSNQPNKDSIQPIKDSNQPVKDSGQPVKDLNRSVKDSGQPVKDSNRSVKDSDQPVKDSNRFVKDSGQPVKDSNRSVKDSNQPVTDSGQPVKDSNRSVKDSNQPNKDSNQHVKDSGQPVKDSNRSVKVSEQSVEDTRGFCQKLFGIDHVLDMLKTTLKQRPQNKRKYILLVNVATTLAYYGLEAQLDLLYIFLTDDPLLWDQRRYSYFSGLNFGLSAAFLLVGLPLTFRWFQIPDALLGVMGTLSRGLGLAMLSLSTTTPMVLICPVLFLFSEYAVPAARSIQSKLVEENERGKIFAFMAVMQNVCFLTGPLLFNSLYPVTATFFKGFPFALAALFEFIAVIIFVYLFKEFKSKPSLLTEIPLDTIKEEPV